MNHPLIRLAAATTLALALPLASHADSFTSSASSAGSASLGSSSDSIKGSSNSSSGDRKVADGDYRVLEVAALDQRPDMLRVRLQAATLREGDTAFALELPRKALAARGLAAGDLVSVRNRAYGLEFAHAPTREAFFLVLNDDWHGELDARTVRF